MKIVVAPNAFKGSLTAHEAAEAIIRGIRKVSETIEVVCSPVADGGDGVTEVLARALHGETLRTRVADPLQRNVTASYCHLDDQQTAIVEMAQASGLVLVEEELRDPEKTTTLGTGQLIVRCLDLDIKRLVIGLGGSATCDGGIGAATALGYRFLDKNGRELEPIGANLENIHTIDARHCDKRIDNVEIEAICDVDNPLTGPDGASFVYSPQKGGNSVQVARLDRGLANLAEVIKKDMGIDIGSLPGAGAAGGLGAGVKAFLGGTLRKGIDLVIDLVGLTDNLVGADLVITGEGSLDSQTIFDKAPAGVARAAKNVGVPCIALCGSIGEGVEELHDIGITAIFSICRKPLNLQQSMAEAGSLLTDTAEQTVRLFSAHLMQ
ncbi:MAG: glycerate kinase [Desulfocapsaceae bacterium]|nr:glycerate kinase [Desulfocapsaceae bacterium]